MDIWTHGTIDQYKACLVARGFHQEYNINFHGTFSLIAKMLTIGILVTGVPYIMISLHCNYISVMLPFTVNALEQFPGFQDNIIPMYANSTKRFMVWNMCHSNGS